MSFTASVGAAATITFDGAGIRVFTSSDIVTNGRARIHVWVDGTDWGKFLIQEPTGGDTYLAKQLAFAVNGLSSSRHTLKLALAEGQLNLDYFEVDGFRREDPVIIKPTAISVTQGGNSNQANRIIDGVGLSAPPTLSNVLTVTSARDDHLIWETAASTAAGYFTDNSNPEPQFILPLDGVYELDSLVVWGFRNVNEATDFRVEFSTNQGTSWGGGETVRTSEFLGVPHGVTGQGKAMRLGFKGAPKANRVSVRVTGNAKSRGLGSGAGGDRVGINEVRLIGHPLTNKSFSTLSGFAYSPATITYGDNQTPTLTAPTGGQGSLSYNTDSTGVCSVNADTGALTISAAGACTVTVVAAATDSHFEARDTFTVTVQKAGQDLSGFGYTPTTLDYGDAAPALTAPPVADGAALTYTSSTLDVCTVAADGALTILRDGACTVTATTEATANYNAATSDEFGITVNPAGALILAVDDVADDNTVNIAEKAAGFAVTGHTGTEAGVSVMLTLDNHTFDTVTSAKAQDATNATWSVPVGPGADYVTGTALVLTVAAAKTGYTAPDDATRSLTVDLTAPSAPSYTVPFDYALTVGVAADTLSPTGGTGIDSYSAEGLPAGLTIDADSGEISGTPSTAAAAASSVTVTVSDTAGNTARASSMTVDFGDVLENTAAASVITLPASGQGRAGPVRLRLYPDHPLTTALQPRS